MSIMRVDYDYIKSLAQDISAHGLQVAPMLTISKNGVLLSDGHHRYCAYKLMQRSTMPVKLKYTDQLKNGITHYNLMPKLLERLYGNNDG